MSSPACGRRSTAWSRETCSTEAGPVPRPNGLPPQGPEADSEVVSRRGTVAPAVLGDPLARIHAGGGFRALFGLRFKSGSWNQGFVVEGRHASLLVTLEKGNLTAGLRPTKTVSFQPTNSSGTARPEPDANPFTDELSAKSRWAMKSICSCEQANSGAPEGRQSTIAETCTSSRGPACAHHRQLALAATDAGSSTASAQRTLIRHGGPDDPPASRSGVGSLGSVRFRRPTPHRSTTSSSATASSTMAPGLPPYAADVRQSPATALPPSPSHPHPRQAPRSTPTARRSRRVRQHAGPPEEEPDRRRPGLRHST